MAIVEPTPQRANLFRIMLWFQIILVLSFSVQQALASNENEKTLPAYNVYAEVLGTAVFLSVNVERVFIVDDRFHLALSVGIGPGFDEDDAFIPVTFSINRGQKKHFFEAGVGYTHRPNPDDGTYIHVVAGYKRQVSNGLLFKLRATPFFPVGGLDEDFPLPFLPWAGLSLGYSW